MFQGKMKALTFSYDDGVTQDRRLIAILDRYGLKGTFNLNSGLFTAAHAFYDEAKNITFPHVCLRASEVAQVYGGHEVAVHTKTHPMLNRLTDEQIIEEVEEDRIALSALAGYDIHGMAYPVGSCAVDDRVTEVIRKHTGVRYSRTTTDTHNFDLPDDPLLLHPTVRHADKQAAEALADRFLALTPDKPQLFCIWGHAYELDRDDDWEWFEAFCRRISGRDDIFYGTLSQILPVS